MSTYAPSEEWEKASKDTVAPLDNEFDWEPDSLAIRHIFACPDATPSVRSSTAEWERYSCPSCGWAAWISRDR